MLGYYNRNSSMECSGSTKIMSKLTEARKKANQKWDQKNKARKAYINKRSSAKSFILKLATQEDLENIKGYIQKREEILKKR